MFSWLTNDTGESVTNKYADEGALPVYLYDNEGNPHYFKNNKGQRQWKRMQKDLNTALDQLADQSMNPTSDVKVNLYGLNDSSNSSLAKIYQNLFDEQIFNNSASNWSYSHQTVQGLQDLNL